MLTITLSYDNLAHIFEYRVNGGKAQYFDAKALDAMPKGLRHALEFERAAQLAEAPGKKADVEAALKLIRQWESRGNRVQHVGVVKEAKPKPSRLKKTLADYDHIPRLSINDLDIED